jgi:hypothetical protein
LPAWGAARKRTCAGCRRLRLSHIGRLLCLILTIDHRPSTIDHRIREGTAMQEKSADPHPLSDLAYDWITLIQNKAQALIAYDQYIKDAEAANSPECAAFFRKVHDTDKAQLAEAKQHLIAVLQGTMGSPAKDTSKP